MLVLVYLALCLVVGFTGRHRRLGFLGYFLLSIVFTPIIMLLILLVTQHYLGHETAASSKAEVCGRCERERRTVSELQYCPHCGRQM
jgi:uncharacterized membrane protein